MCLVSAVKWGRRVTPLRRTDKQYLAPWCTKVCDLGLQSKGSPSPKQQCCKLSHCQQGQPCPNKGLICPKRPNGQKGTPSPFQKRPKHPKRPSGQKGHLHPPKKNPTYPKRPNGKKGHYPLKKRPKLLPQKTQWPERAPPSSKKRHILFQKRKR